MGQGDLARDFDPAESSGNAGILFVFPIFRTARMGAKGPPKPAAPIVRCCPKILSIILIRFVEKINFCGAYQCDSHFHKVIKSRPIITANQKCHDCQTIALNNRGTFSFYRFGTLSHLIRTAFCIFIIISELKKVVKR